MMHYKVMFIIVMLISYSKHLQATLIVAKDGSGNYTSISEAVNASPSHSSIKFYIRVKSGIYEEKVYVGAEKTNIVLVGDGVSQTIISGSRSIGGEKDLSSTATVEIYADGFVARDLTIENLADANKHQAVALATNANRLTFYKCRITGHQDTVYAMRGTQFFRNCDIVGTVDIICGNAAVIFQVCTIIVLRPLDGQSNVITAQKKESDYETSGTVIQVSKITATEDLRLVKTYLGRPWGRFSTTIIMKSFLDAIIDPAGWLRWESRGTIDPVEYAEYQNTGPGANTTNRVPWAKVFRSPGEVSKFTVKNFIKGHEWIPRDVPFFPDLP